MATSVFFRVSIEPPEALGEATAARVAAKRPGWRMAIQGKMRAEGSV